MKTLARTLLVVSILTGFFGLCAYVTAQPDPAREGIDALVVNRLVFNRDFADAISKPTHRVRDHTRETVQSYLAYARSLVPASVEESEAITRCESQATEYAMVAGHLVPLQLADQISARLPDLHPAPHP